MPGQLPLGPENRADESGAIRNGMHLVTADLCYKRLTLVNVVFWGMPGTPDWVLIDAGIPGHAGAILTAAERRFGPRARPRAILMTHGHFDHAGSLEALAELWDVPIYAHPLEHPYLNGEAAYPPPDPTVGGGMLASLSPLFPVSPVNVSPWLQSLPQDGRVPEMPGWRWIHTPGHTPGHVSLFRERDRALIAGDAFITTRQESAYAVMLQKPEMHGPPSYFTQDWDASRNSVQRLAALEPELVITGHGRPMAGEQMRATLHQLADRFDEIAVPEGGKYVTYPHRATDGTAYRSP